MSTLTLLVLMLLCLTCGLVFGFVAGLDWRDHQDRMRRRRDDYASRYVIQANRDNERRLYVVRNGKVL